ncbi:MAG: hypothetical protein GPW16_04840 [Euryarchaeota archaeon]|nr:hypothetical protein [Euryarchaeota archaeon]
MLMCKDCKYASKYLKNSFICLNKNSMNYGYLFQEKSKACDDFLKGTSDLIIHPSYLWCYTCNKTIFPDFELSEHLGHKISIDIDLEDIRDYSDIILYGGD